MSGSLTVADFDSIFAPEPFAVSMLFGKCMSLGRPSAVGVQGGRRPSCVRVRVLACLVRAALAGGCGGGARVLQKPCVAGPLVCTACARVCDNSVQ